MTPKLDEIRTMRIADVLDAVIPGKKWVLVYCDEVGGGKQAWTLSNAKTEEQLILLNLKSFDPPPPTIHPPS